MDIHIAVEGRHDLAGQIYRQLRAGIIEGRLAGGTQLPSTRDLATQLGVSRKTTLDVFERLLAEGFLNARAGSGTFVAEGLQRLPAERSSHARAAHDAMGTLGTHGVHGVLGTSAAAQPGARAQPVWSAVPEVLAPQPTLGTSFDFTGGITDKAHFPFDVWRRCVNHALRVQSRGRGIYRDAAGEQELRLAISRYLAFSRAVASNWEDVIVTQGAQHALDLIARVTLRPGDVAVVEDPGYPPARACLTAVGAKVVPVPVDADGLIVSKLPKNARLVYVTPSHQFPLGMPMSLERRVALLEWAGKRGAVIVEDDYDGEFRYDRQPVGALQALAPDRVAYAGTASKSLTPGLRLGWLVVPPALLEPVVEEKRHADRQHGVLDQLTLADFLSSGDYARQGRRARAHYRRRRDTLVSVLAPTGARITGIAAGLHAVVELPAAAPPLPDLVRAAAARGLGLEPLSSFGAAPETRALAVGYATPPEHAYRGALERLAAVLDGPRP
jgi:GntR family transcriptional regulator/MocR family aminotransferase